MRIRMIALDLDGTLLHSQAGLTKRTKDVLEKCISKGVHIVVASGRSYASLPQSVLAVPGIEYAITSNGVAVQKKSTGERLFHFPLKAESVRQIVKIVRVQDTTFETFVAGVPYAQARYVADPVSCGATEWAVPYVQRTRRPVEDLYAFAEEHIEHLDALDMVTRSSEEKAYLMSELKKLFGIYVTSSIPHLIEISDEMAGKRAALQRLTEYLGIDPSETAAFGNAENDIEMIRYAGIGVAVADSDEEVRTAADVICPECNDEGVANLLEEWFELGYFD